MMISESAEGIRVEIKVQPRAFRNQIAGMQGGYLRIKLTAPPVDGAANRALIDFLASELNTAKSNINLVRGVNSKNKLIEIKGISKAEFLSHINPI